MILVLGSTRDPVFSRLTRELGDAGQVFASVDEDSPAQYQVLRHGTRWRLSGGNCYGTRQVRSVFVRHAVPRTLDPTITQLMASLQTQLNRILPEAGCPVVNQPGCALSNYSKPYQLSLLAAAGFDVPRTLVTNSPTEARRFIAELGGTVIFKGISNMMSFAQLLRPELEERLKLLPHCPTQFQEFISGDDLRVHVVGGRVLATRLRARNEDYRRSAIVDREAIVAEEAVLPEGISERCVAFTRSLGLSVGGLDFKEGPEGRLVALELNPYPQFTFYEGRSGQPITRAVVDLLAEEKGECGRIFA